MNSFDSMIERYKKELIDAKRRSIEKEIAESSVSAPDYDAEPVFAAEDENAEPTAFEPEVKAVPVFSPDAGEEDSAFEARNGDRNFEAGEALSSETFSREPLGLSNPLETLSERAADDARAKEQNAGQTAEPIFERAAGQEGTERRADFQSESDIPDDENAVFEENEPFPESLGALKVQVFMANRAYPVSSAHVVITGKENKKVYFDGYTNTNGIVGSLLLPAPKKSFSQSPQEKPPYSQYDITVTHPKFQKRQYLGVPVFAGVESIQNIQLLPLGTDETQTDVTESEPNELLMRGGERNA